MNTYIVIAMICVLLFFSLLIIKKVGFSTVFEKVTILLFKLACSFAFLFIAHIMVDEYNIVVPINLFSAMTITVLGVPGVLCIGVLTLLQ